MYRFPGQSDIDSRRLLTIANLPGPLLAGTNLFPDLGSVHYFCPKLEHRPCLSARSNSTARTAGPADP